MAYPHSLRVLAALALAAFAITACAPVPAYERGRLAHPTMTTADIAGAAEAHTRAVQEGATGGGFEVGGGCGCN
jgi:hypothetical protein